MKKLIAIFIIFTSIIAFIIGGTVHLIINRRVKTNTEEAVYLPKVTLKDIEGNSFKFNKIEEDTIILFWLPQSKVSRLQLNLLNELYQDQKEDLDIIAVAIGKVAQDELKKIKDEDGLEFPLLIDLNVELSKKMKVTTIPTLIFYKPYKSPIFKYGLIDQAKLTRLINTYLN